MKDDPANEPHLVKVWSHWVEISGQGAQWYELHKETVRLDFEAVWRKHPVVVTMEADRYRSSSGLVPWRITVHKVDPEVSGTARSRLRDDLTPLVEAWLDSPAYIVSEQSAYAHMLRGKLGECKASYSKPTDDVRRLLQQHTKKVTTEFSDKLYEALHAFDEYAALYKEL